MVIVPRINGQQGSGNGRRATVGQPPAIAAVSSGEAVKVVVEP